MKIRMSSTNETVKNFIQLTSFKSVNMKFYPLNDLEWKVRNCNGHVKGWPIGLVKVFLDPSGMSASWRH